MTAIGGNECLGSTVLVTAIGGNECLGSTVLVDCVLSRGKANSISWEEFTKCVTKVF